MTTKPFDCVAMVEWTQAEIQERLETMSREEQLAFWRAQTERLRERQECEKGEKIPMPFAKRK